MVRAVRQAISRDAQMFLVTTPEKFSLNEALRVTEALQNSSLPVEISAVVLNRAVLRAGKCPLCRRRAALTASAQKTLRQHYPRRPVLMGEDWGAPVQGAPALRAFAAQVFEGKIKRLPEVQPPPAP